MRLFPILICVLAAGTAYGWGERGHQTVNHAAVQTLPDDGPVFLKIHEEWIAVKGRVPDTWRTLNEPFVKILEDPNHGWFKEQFAFMKEIPRSRYEFVLALYDEYLHLKDKDPERARLTNVRWTGTLPYAAMENYERLKSGFRIYREQRAARQETKYTELDLAFYMGWLGHYTADGAMPLHASIHHDGWQGPNPKNYTRDGRIHGRFESQFVDLLPVRVEDVRPLVGKARVLRDPFQAILDHLDRAATHVEEVYQLDQVGAYQDQNNAAAKRLVLERLGSGAELLRDLVYTAWVESAKPPLPGGGANNPISPQHPKYNPATGSAPAPKP